MAQFDYYVKGPVLFARVFERNKREYNPNDEYPTAEGGQYSIVIGVEEDSEEEAIIRSWSHMRKARKPKDFGEKYADSVPEGYIYFQFKRDHEVRNKKTGEMMKSISGPPMVLDPDGNRWDDSIDIGNGSICTLKFHVNKLGKKTFVRLEGLRVDDHVEFEGGDYEETEEVGVGDAIPF